MPGHVPGIHEFQRYSWLNRKTGRLVAYSPAAIEISGSGRPSRSRFSLSAIMKAS